MGKVVGIDLGTTNSLVAYVRDGAPRVIRDSSGDALVPSVVSLGDEGTIFVGREAQRRCERAVCPREHPTIFSPRTAVVARCPCVPAPATRPAGWVPCCWRWRR